VQALPDHIYNVDLLGTAYVIDSFEKVTSAGTSMVLMATIAGHVPEATIAAD
jgi:hypothetical protein